MKEKIRLAVRTILAQGNRLTVDRVRGNGCLGVPKKVITDTLRQYRAGLLDLDTVWTSEDDPEIVPSDLAGIVADADSYEKIGLALREVSKATVDGSLSGAKATALKSLLSEARQVLKQKHLETPPEIEDDIVPISKEAFEIALLWEGIVDDDARKRVREYLLEHVNQDLIDNPNTDGAKT